jgi:hypothetical protein
MRLIEINPRATEKAETHSRPQKAMAPRASRPKSATALRTIKPIKPMSPKEALIHSLKQQIVQIKKRIAAVQASASYRNKVHIGLEHRSYEPTDK